MFKTTLALVLLSSVAVAAPAQRGQCDQKRNCQTATPAVTADIQDKTPAQEVDGKEQGQGLRKNRKARGKGKGKGQKKGQGCGDGCGDATGKKGKAKAGNSNKGKGRSKGLAQKAKARKNQCAEAGCGPGKKGQKANRNQKANMNQQGRKAGKGNKECQPCAGPNKGNKTAAEATVAVKLTEEVSADQAKKWVKRLQPVLEAELYAQEYYEAAAKALNGVRRFENLARAEGNHANAISNAITTFGGKPSMDQPTAIVIPKTIEAADKHCEEVELQVIKIYDGLIKDAPTPQLKNMFENIQRANRRHLNAVQ